MTAETDLLGDPLPETPSMTASLPWRVFFMNECDWWIARTLDEAKAAYRADVGDEDEYTEDAYELNDEALDRLKFIVDAELPPEKWERRTFKEELAHRVSAGLSKPEHFASTEY